MSDASHPEGFVALKKIIEDIQQDPYRNFMLKDREDREARLKRDWDAERIAKAKRLSCIGERFQGQTFQTFEQTDDRRDALTRAWEIVINPRLGVCYYGPSGTGKTHLVGAIAHACIQRGFPVILNSVPAILRTIRASYDDASILRENEQFNLISTVPVLIFDDLGKEAFSAWSLLMLHDLIDIRERHSLPIILTTNLNEGKFIERYMRYISGLDESMGDSLIKRILEMCGPWILVPGESRRKRG